MGPRVTENEHALSAAPNNLLHPEIVRLLYAVDILFITQNLSSTGVPSL